MSAATDTLIKNKIESQVPDYVYSDPIANKKRQVEMGSYQTGMKKLRKNIFLYILLSPGFILRVVFGILPLFGIIIAFKAFNSNDWGTGFDLVRGMFLSPWADNNGFQYMVELFTLPEMQLAITNTISISMLGILTSFPVPIILALLFNELKYGIFKKVSQTVSYLPHFLSSVTVLGIVNMVYGADGPINSVVRFFGGDTIHFLQIPSFYWPNMLITQIWQGSAWGSILYLAGIANADPQLYEAAKIDGAGRLRQTWIITLPCIIPIFVIQMIFSLGGILGSNFTFLWGMRNNDITKNEYLTISTYMYMVGFEQGDYSRSTGVGLTLGVISFFLTMSVNYVADKLTGTSVY